MDSLTKIFKGGFVELGKFLGGKSTRNNRKDDRKNAERKQRKDADRKNRKTRRNNLF